MRVLITGVNGFVGSHLAEYCLSQGDDVSGTVRNQNESLDNLSPSVLKDVVVYECELTDYKNVLQMLKDTKPEVIFHLAAQSFVPTSWKSPAETIVNNSVAQINLFEAIRELGIDPVVQIACSSEQYGLVKENELPIKESNVFRPLSPYAVSKVTQEMLAYQYHQSYGLRTVITRAFNHEGPRRGTQFVTANFAKQIADMPEEGGVIKVGNLDAIRDFSDVRDIVRGYYIATTCENIDYGESYNLCSGEGVTIKEVLDTLIAISGKNVTIEVDQERMRPSDVPVLIGDCSKFYNTTSWEPKLDLYATLEDTYNYYKGKQ